MDRNRQATRVTLIVAFDLRLIIGFGRFAPTRLASYFFTGRQMPEAHFFLEVGAIVLTLFSVGFILYEIHTHGRRHKEEIRLQEARFDFDKKRWQLEAEHVAVQAGRLEKFIVPMADRLKDQLKADPEWIADALRRSELFPYESSIFGRRSEYYKEEKDCLARQFTKLLIEHLEHLAQTNPRICLIIDSGTTLYPVFEHIGQAALADVSASWVSRVEIITNNLPGVFNLMRATRRPSVSDASPVPIKCTVVAGQLLTNYVAVTGEDTQTSIRQLLENREGSYNISLVTGNWVRLRKQAPRCPIPLARGSGHVEFKQAIMSVSRESYVIAPLGKLLNTTKPDASTLLSGVEKGYHEVNTDDRGSRVIPDSVKLVTTHRVKSPSILHSYGVSLMAALDAENARMTRHLRDMRHVFVSFDPETDDANAQKIIEFPNPDTRNDGFYRLFLIDRY